MGRKRLIFSRKTFAAAVLVVSLGASACAISDQPSANAPPEGDCGPGAMNAVATARSLMDSKVPSGNAVFRGAADVCGVDEFEIGVGRSPALARDRSTRASASVFFTPTVLVGEEGQELTLFVTHDGRSKTHSFTIDELDIDELIFSGDEDGIGSRKSVEVTFPTDGKPLLFYCRFHRTGGMWGALVTN